MSKALGKYRENLLFYCSSNSCVSLNETASWNAVLLGDNQKFWFTSL